MQGKPTFSDKILAWFDQHGRKNLPWQHKINPYRVWVSEIMLQQTQVATVIPYFQRFMEELPEVEDLAAADEDEVLHLWTGLGYYARARNLHKTAQQVCSDFSGEFPSSLEELCSLPGIGLSTAGAIRSIAFRQPAAILDGNVKRVLARHGAIGGWPGQSSVLKALWAAAEKYTPVQRVADYSQAMMDLGATVCTRSSPLCEDCPLEADCRALAEDRIGEFPGRKPRKKLPIKTTVMLMATNPQGEVLLVKRPAQGIWGGLWSFPELAEESDPLAHCREFGLDPESVEHWDNYRHTFSHYHLDIKPARVMVAKAPPGIMEAERQLWYNSASPPSIGLAAPVARLLEKLKTTR